MTYDIPGMLQHARVLKPTQGGAGPLKSTFINPMNRYMYHSSRGVVETNKGITYKILRNVAERAWIINAIIDHYIRNVVPFLKLSTDKNIRGFNIALKDKEHTVTNEEKKLAKIYRQFFLRNGFGEDPEREDDL